MRALRYRLRLTAAAMAARLGVPSQTYRQWEYGRRAVRSPAVLCALEAMKEAADARDAAGLPPPETPPGLSGLALGREALSPEKVRELRRRAAAGETYKELSKEFGVNWQTVGSYIKGRLGAKLPLLSQAEQQALESDGRATLTPAQVYEFRRRADAGERIPALSEEFGIKKWQGYAIAARRAWRSLPEAAEIPENPL
jgi:transcriptional regulator with XRE-family HTH domain